MKTLPKKFFKRKSKPQDVAKNILITSCFTILATIVAFWFFYTVPEQSANIVLVYITTLVLVSRFTTGYIYGITFSLIGVICVNYLFTYPYFNLNFTLTGYPITFLFMLIISITISTMTSQIIEQNEIILEREKLLMEAEKEKMRANLLRSVSHDLRTPLTGIIGNTSTYIDNAETLSEHEKTDIVKQINDASNWLLHMVENLLSVTRIEETSMKIATSMESVEEVIAEAIMRLRKRIPDVALNVQVPETFLMIPMDAMLIEQVIINLVENAVDHAKSTLPIDLTVIEHQDSVAFHIKDYGIGIAPERLSSIFDGSPYTPQTPSDIHKGMGIGLSICKTIITAHNGSITAANHENGCMFTFILPKEN